MSYSHIQWLIAQSTWNQTTRGWPAQWTPWSATQSPLYCLLDARNAFFLKSHCSTSSQELCSAKVKGNWTTGCLYPPQKWLTLKTGVSAGDALEIPLKLQGIPREALKPLGHTHAVSASPCAQPLSLILSRYCPQMILMQISISGPSFSIFLCSRLVLLNTLVTSNMAAEPLKCS